MNVEAGMQIGDLWGIVRRRRKPVAAAALLISLAGYWIAMSLPNEYASFATVLVEPQSVAPELVQAGVPASDINNRLFLMTAEILSRGRLSRIIDELELYQPESRYMVREDIIGLMRAKISVVPIVPELAAGIPKSKQSIGNINQFKISFTHNEARTAMRVAQKLSNDFIDEHLENRVSVSKKSLEFIDEELQRLAVRIRTLEARIAEVKAENPGRLPEDLAANQRRIERLLADLTAAQRLHAEAVSDEAFYLTEIHNAHVVADRDDLTPARRLKVLDLAIVELKAKGFTDKHPDVVKTTLEIEELKEVVTSQEAQAAQAEAEAEESEDEAPLTFAQQNAEAQRRRATIRKEAAEEQISRLQGSIDDVQLLLAETPAVAEILDGLNREYIHLSSSYQDFSNRQLEATVQAQLERRQYGEQFRVLESAFIAPAPTSPNRPMIIAIGLIFALMIGGVVGVVLEAVDGSLHSARQLQTAVGIPVLASIPNILLEPDLAALRRTRIRTAFATTALIIFCLAGGAANYMWVNGSPSFLASDEAEEATEESTEESTEAELSAVIEKVLAENTGYGA